MAAKKLTPEARQSTFDTFFEYAEDEARAGNWKQAQFYSKIADDLAQPLDVIEARHAKYDAENPRIIIPPFLKRDAGRPPIWSREPDE